MKKILIAEDEIMYGKVLKNKLEKEGFQVTYVQDGEQALKALRESSPDLLLLDLIMPVKNGMQTLQEIKKDEKLKNTKVIVLSNLGQEEDIKKIMDLGANDYLVKADVQFTEAIAKIKSYIQ